MTITLTTLRAAHQELKALATMGVNKPLVATPSAVEYKQYRFPRSKKKRVRTRWSKRFENFRTIPAVYESAYVTYVHPSIYNRIKQEFKKANRTQMT